jgi:hypothetical protein
MNCAICQLDRPDIALCACRRFICGGCIDDHIDECNHREQRRSYGKENMARS